MRATRNTAGIYTVTGHTAQGELVQYEVSKNGSGWAVDLIYGKGIQLCMLYPSKAAAIKAITNQG